MSSEAVSEAFTCWCETRLRPPSKGCQPAILVQAYMFKYASTHGLFKGSLKVVDDTTLEINGKQVKVTSKRNPEDIPWGDYGVQYVAEKATAHKKICGASRHACSYIYLLLGLFKSVLNSDRECWRSWTDGLMNFGEREDSPYKGEKEVSEGTPDCLAGLTIVISGTLDRLNTRRSLLSTMTKESQKHPMKFF